ncbi:hypothetical protein QR680_008406 [Steinernema hermaphroditum]|uniref:5'-3' exoribonuclease n=1 Tax=Steinernema hermaphroditum TaxID=289476 RepID=A0AA39M7Z3_9BILA|nr:hypothetical protein QR680_008406 [Steinernema hermaphroditum]
MGVPAFFRWLSRKYPAIISNANEERPVEVNGVKVPVDCTKPNPNFQEFDNLYLDMNGIIHPCTHPEDRPAPRNEDEMFALIFEYIDRMFAIVRPRRLLYMAIDGVAPRAKMNQQRSRRFRSSKEAAEKEEQIRKVRERLEADGCPLPPEKKEEEKFDSNCITPGTPFMARLADALRYYIHNRITNDAAWAKIEVILSDANVPGEGEHKIMDYIRRQRASPNHDPNTVHCLCGADADLIMLGLATHEANFNIIREEFVPNQPRPCELCGQYGHELNDCQGLATEEVAAHQSDPLDKTTNFVFIRLPVLREYLEKDLAMPNLPFPFDLERVLDDWVFMCFFVGNDFLPHLPSLEIREGAIDRLIKLYKDVCVLSNGYLTENGNVNIDRAQRILNGLGDVEDQIFQERQRREVRFRENRKRQRRSAPAYIPTKGLLAPLSAPQAMTGEQTRELARDARVEAMQYSNAQETQQRLGAILQPAGTAAAGNDRKRKATEDLDSEEEEPYDEVRLYEEGWRERYYASKFDVAASDVDFRRQVAEAYMEGLCWVLRYYYQGCGSWDWFYPYHYAPFASDFDRIYDFKPDFTKPTKPFKPLEQLMCVFPAASRKHIPEPWHYLMTDTESPIIDFYPNDFQIDLNGKKFAWQGVALLPFVDEDRLLGTLSEVQDKLSDEEKHRNSLGPSRVFLGTQHPAYQFFAEIYNHEGEVPVDLDSKLLYGMGGTIQKDNLVVLPGNAYGSAVSHETCQDIATNACISAIYADPFFGPEFVFPAVRLPGCAELQKTLKPENWNDRRDGQYRPQIGFNRDAPRASLDPGAMRGFRNEVHNRSYHNDRRDYSNDRNNRHSFPSARGYQGGWVPPGGHHRGGFHAHGGQHHQRGGHGHGGHHRDDRRNGRDWDQQRGGGRGGRGRPYRGH